MLSSLDMYDLLIEDDTFTPAQARKLIDVIFHFENEKYRRELASLRNEIKELKGIK